MTEKYRQLFFENPNFKVRAGTNGLTTSARKQTSDNP